MALVLVEEVLMGLDEVKLLLDQAVEHVWNAEQANTFAIGFGDGFATDRIRPIRPIQELLYDFREMGASPFRELGDGQTVGSGSAPVPADLLPSTFEIRTVYNKLE